MKNKLLFLRRDTRDCSAESIAERRYQRMKGKTLKHILIDRFIHHYGFEKGVVTATAIVNDIIELIEQYYRFTDNSFLKEGQLVWPCVPADEYPAKGKSMHQTRLKPVVLDFITTDDVEDMKKPLHHREIRLKKIERWTNQVFDQGAVLSNLDLSVLLCVNENTAAEYVRISSASTADICPPVVMFSLLGVVRLTNRLLFRIISTVTLFLKFVKEPTTPKKRLNVISETLRR